MVEIVVW